VTRWAAAPRAAGLIAVPILVGTLLNLAAGVTTAAASGPGPQIAPSTRVIVPGKSFVVTGQGWSDGTALDVTICGANAVSGTADCAVTATATMTATSRGLVWAQMTGEIPPVACPCVLLVSGATDGYTKTIPVQVVGARTAPVPPASLSGAPALRVSGVRVLGNATLASSLGGGARRTLELHIANSGNEIVTVVLVARWGSGKDPQNVITMPAPASLRPGKSEEVKSSFALGAFSVGDYRVRVEVQMVGYSHVIALSSSTSQWPIALFCCGGVLAALLVIVTFLAITGRRRRRHELDHAQATPSTSQALPQAPAAGDDLPSSPEGVSVTPQGNTAVEDESRPSVQTVPSAVVASSGEKEASS